MVVHGTHLPSPSVQYSLLCIAVHITLTISLCNGNIDYLGIPQAGLRLAIASLPKAFSSSAMQMEASGKFCCLQVSHVNLEHL